MELTYPDWKNQPNLVMAGRSWLKVPAAIAVGKGQRRVDPAISYPKAERLHLQVADARVKHWHDVMWGESVIQVTLNLLSVR